MENTDRSYLPITRPVLHRLADIASQDREKFFRNHSRWSSLYVGRLLCVALCQGAALHFLDHQNGIKDFDVWSFFWSHPDAPIPRRPVMSYDFGDPSFGKSPDRPDFIGRRVDTLLKSIDCAEGEGPVAAIQRYLSQRGTRVASFLAQKAIVLIEPIPLLGVVAWPQIREPSTELPNK